MSGLIARDATDQLAALAAGEITAVALLEAELARHAAEHGRINAVINTDLVRARAEAAAIDVARAAGQPLGPLAGLPMTIKDTYDVEGMPASAGVAAVRQREAKDAVTVARVRAAGAVIWGKTNSPVDGGDWQTFNADFGTTNNPWDVTRTTGGSSGGAAAALATQVSALELGSDIAGSLRLPAAFCGVFAHKPTWNLLSRIGHVPPAPGALSPGDLTVMGPMARSVRDLALLLHVMSGGETPKAVSPADRKTLKVGLWLDDPAMMLDPAVRLPIEAFAERARAGGVSVVPIASPVDGEALLWTYNFLLMAHLGATFPERAWNAWVAKRETAKAEVAAGAGPLSYAATVLAATASHRDWVAVDETRHRLRAAMDETFGEVDVIVTPVAPVEPFRHDHSHFHSRTLTRSDGAVVDYALMKTWVALATALGLPATSIPAGFSGAGLPIGVQVVGPYGADAATLAAAAALEPFGGGYVAPPLA